TLRYEHFAKRGFQRRPRDTRSRLFHSEGISMSFARMFLISATIAFAGCGPADSKSGSPLSGRTDDGSAAPFFLERKDASDFLVGAGIGDITGPVVGLETMGYAAPAPTTGGLHQRLWSRAYVIAERSQPDQRLVYV